jgi:molybdopterin-guanine dinucleotide biosynthesis protein B
MPVPLAACTNLGYNELPSITRLFADPMKIIGFAGWSGSGKTTVIEQIVPVLQSENLSVSLIKHAHHQFDIDQPGKDSWRHRQAGCREVLVTSSVRWALIHELQDEEELTLRGALGRLSPCDLVLVEGFKRAVIPKLEIHRASVGKPLLYPDDPNVIGVATDAPAALAEGSISVLDLNNVSAIAEFVIRNSVVLPIDFQGPDL